MNVSSFTWVIVITGLLTLLGSGTLLFITVKYYWGDRGTPPATGELRRRQKEEELQLRAAQIERAKAHPVLTRKPDFWDNSKPR